MAAPAVPVNLVAQQANGQVFLSWSISSGSTTYPVLRSTDNVTFVQIAAPAVNYYLDTSVTVGVQYFYKVEASNGDVSSPTQAQSIIPALGGQLPLGAIRLAAQQRADRVNSNFVSMPEWNSYINQSYFELYDLLVDTYEDYFLAVPYVFTTDGSAAQYTMPDGSDTYEDANGDTAKPFYKLLGVDCGQDANNNARVTVHKFDFIERNRYVYPNLTSTFLGVFNLRYRLVGNSLFFIPNPAGGQIITVWYIPRLASLLQDTDMVDGVSGWTEYIIVDAAIKALQKEESDVSVLMAQKQALIDRIQSTAMNRDAGMPDTISRTRRADGYYGGGGWDGSFGGY